MFRDGFLLGSADYTIWRLPRPFETPRTDEMVTCHIPGGRNFQANRCKIVQTRCSPRCLQTAILTQYCFTLYTEHWVCVCVCWKWGPGAGVHHVPIRLCPRSSRRGLLRLQQDTFCVPCKVTSSPSQCNIILLHRDWYKARARAQIDTKHEPNHLSL
jgi:hypothetical protein